jgi:YVTN family beta-propeller protein
MSASSLKAKLGCAAALVWLVSLSNVAARAQTQVATIPAGTPTDVSVNLVTGLVYVPSGRQVDVISDKTDKIAYSIPVATAYGLVPDVINPATNTLYLGDQHELFVVNAATRQVTATVNVPAAGLAVNVATNKIYVSDFNSNVYVIDGATNNIIKDIALPPRGREPGRQPGHESHLCGHGGRLLRSRRRDGWQHRLSDHNRQGWRYARLQRRR